MSDTFNVLSFKLDKKNLNIVERYFFALILILNLIPILVGDYFPSIDGAAHLYNSQLLNTLLFDKDSVINDFFSFNPEPIPNWSGHLILMAFNLFLPAFIAEKILLLFYAITLPLVFRSLMKNIAPGGLSLSYFIFPFTYSFVFCLGFYNFSIALIFIFVTLNYWIKHDGEISSPRNRAVLFILLLVTYFSHVLLFGLLLMLLAFYEVTKSIFLISSGDCKLSEVANALFKRLYVLFICSVVPLIFFVYYFYSRLSYVHVSFISKEELFEWLIDLRPIIIYDYEADRIYSSKIVYVIVFLCVIVLWNKAFKILSEIKFYSKCHFSQSLKNVFGFSFYWLLSSLILLWLYFVLPDSDGIGGYVSVRLGLLFFLFLILFLATQEFPRWLNVLTIVAVLYCNFNLISSHTDVAVDLNKMSEECDKASNFIRPNSIVLPLNFSSNWLHSNFANYLGVDKPMVILQNYECGTGYFPLTWNKEDIPNLKLSKKNLTDFSCSNWANTGSSINRFVDYIFVMGDMEVDKDRCLQEISLVIAEKYSLVYYSENCKLYKMR